MKITIPDYGCGNLASVARMIEKAGGTAEICREPAWNADKLIIAGVGAFDHGMRSLRESGWAEALDEAVRRRGVPVLGICLGMQLLCNSSEEGSALGLGWIEAASRRFRPEPGSTLKVPHMGWNQVNVQRVSALMPKEDEMQRFYFVHSYHVECASNDDVLATAEYGVRFAAAIHRENIFGVQFHPEKSHRFGMQLLRNFIDLSC